MVQISVCCFPSGVETAPDPGWVNIQLLPYSRLPAVRRQAGLLLSGRRFSGLMVGVIFSAVAVGLANRSGVRPIRYCLQHLEGLPDS